MDPEWARRRYEQAVADRTVVGSRNPDGSANLAGYNLPVDRVATAGERIDALAKAAQRAGSARPIDHLRAELFLGMTDGAYAGCDDTTIVELLLAAQQDDIGTGEHATAPAREPDAAAGANGRADHSLEHPPPEPEPPPPPPPYDPDADPPPF